MVMSLEAPVTDSKTSSTTMSCKLPKFDGKPDHWEEWSWTAEGILRTTNRRYPKFLHKPLDGILDDIRNQAATTASSSSSTTTTTAITTMSTAVDTQIRNLSDQAMADHDHVCFYLVSAFRGEATRVLNGVDSGDAYATWQRLLTEYRGIGQASVSQTYASIWKMQADETKPISSLISELNKYFDRLIFNQEPVSDMHRASALKAALPSRFATLKTILDSQTLTYKEVCRQIVNFDTTSKTSSGAPTSGSSPVSASSYSARAIECYNCHKEGHVVNDCKAPCRRPHHAGHLGKECRALYKNRKHKHGAQAHAETFARQRSKTGRGQKPFADATVQAQPRDQRQVTYKGKRKASKSGVNIVIDSIQDAQKKKAKTIKDDDDSDSSDSLWGISNMLSAFMSSSIEPVLGFDPCSSYHIASSMQKLENLRQLPPVTVSVANGDKVALTQGGDLHVSVFNHRGEKNNLILKGTYQAPEAMSMNLLSMGILDIAGLHSQTSGGKLAISTNKPGPMFKEGIIATGYRVPNANIFVVKTKEGESQANFAAP